MDSLSVSDAGNYTCEAISVCGRDTRHVYIHVRPLSTVLLVLRMTATSVTVSWKNTVHTNDYRITYRQQKDDNMSVVTTIKHYMRTYTISDLQPETAYHFCISVKLQDEKWFIVNCTAVITRHRQFVESGLRSFRAYVIGFGVAGILLTSCLILFAIGAGRRYDKIRNRCTNWPQDVAASSSRDHLAQVNLSDTGLTNVASETFENVAAAAIFDEADLVEIRSTASMTTSLSTTR